MATLIPYSGPVPAQLDIHQQNFIKANGTTDILPGSNSVAPAGQIAVTAVLETNDSSGNFIANLSPVTVPNLAAVLAALSGAMQTTALAQLAAIETGNLWIAQLIGSQQTPPLCAPPTP